MLHDHLPLLFISDNLLRALFVKGRLLSRLVTALRTGVQESPRAGHMGYVIRLCLMVVDLGVGSIRALGVSSEDLDAWGSLMTTCLADELQAQRQKLGLKVDDDSDEEPARASPTSLPLHVEDEEATWRKEVTKIWPDSPRACQDSTSPTKSLLEVTGS